MATWKPAARRAAATPPGRSLSAATQSRDSAAARRASRDCAAIPVREASSIPPTSVHASLNVTAPVVLSPVTYLSLVSVN